ADLDQLLGYCERHLASDGAALFPKGASWKKEIEAAQRSWRFDMRVDKSRTEVESVILSITGVARV
ncbi:MAG: 16S rRNA (guanine(527)-N(7))-methyltransferase RsmG, partial [Gammaproteobacteria bacterium]|nr:16S rRNA (guanine(527)-N(7))-methyltransferase RsmG [Gammaproteobacteria bacterium]